MNGAVGSLSQVEDFYASRGIGASVGFGLRPAVVVVDVSRAFTSSSYGVGAEVGPPVLQIASLLRNARAVGIPIVYTTIAYDPRSEDGAYFGAKIPALRELRTDDPMAVDIDPLLERLPSELLLVKKFPSAFFATQLASFLIQTQIDTLIVTGCSTSGCVRATVTDAVSYGFRVIVPEECVFDRAEEPHKTNLFDINAKYADVVPQAVVDDYLGGLSVQTS